MEAIVNFLMNTEPWHWVMVSLGAIVLFAIVLDVTRPDDTSVRPQKMSIGNFLLQYDPKKADVEGAYAIHNVKQDKWLVSSSPHVYREVKARIDGKIKPFEIHQDIRANEPFEIYVLKLTDDKLSRAELCEKLETIFAAEKAKY